MGETLQRIGEGQGEMNEVRMRTVLLGQSKPSQTPARLFRDGVATPTFGANAVDGTVSHALVARIRSGAECCC
jgi:hypothetical protein